MREIPSEKLSYRQIDIELPADTYDESCLKKKAPTAEDRTACVKVKGTQIFIANLQKAGWIESEWKSYKNFVRKDVPIEISVQPFKHLATIRPESLERVRDRLLAIVQAVSAEQKKQAQADEVLQRMKGQ